MTTADLTPREPAVRFQLIGAVEAYIDGVPHKLGSPRERLFLLPLLAAPGRPVPRTEIIEWIWDGFPPDEVQQELNGIAYRLRKRLEPIGLRDRLEGGDGMYRLDVPPASVDVHQFATLVGKARQADDDGARNLLFAAVQLRQGIPLGGLMGSRVESYRQSLVGEHRAALIKLTRIEVRHGRGLEWIPELARLFDESPDNALVTETYMTALHNVGRQFDALQVYDLYSDAKEGLGLPVAEELTELRDRIRKKETSMGAESPAPDAPESQPEPDPESSTEPTASIVVNYVEKIRGKTVVLGPQYRTRR